MTVSALTWLSFAISSDSEETEGQKTKSMWGIKNVNAYVCINSYTRIIYCSTSWIKMREPQSEETKTPVGRVISAWELMSKFCKLNVNRALGSAVSDLCLGCLWPLGLTCVTRLGLAFLAL